VPGEGGGRAAGGGGGAAPRVVAGAGSGPGTVTSSPAGINCGSDCSEAYALGTAVTLTAFPAAGGVFTGWSGACAGQGNPCQVTMTADQSVTASFALNFTVSVSRAGTGSGAVTSTPAGIDCGTACFASYPRGTSVTLPATPAAGAGFAGWT